MYNIIILQGLFIPQKLNIQNILSQKLLVLIDSIQQNYFMDIISGESTSKKSPAFHK